MSCVIQLCPGISPAPSPVCCVHTVQMQREGWLPAAPSHHWKVKSVGAGGGGCLQSPTRDIEQHNLATAQSRENFPGDSEPRLSFLATDLVVRPRTSTDKYISYIVLNM